VFLNILFWTCFVCEAGLIIWLLLDELKLTYQQPNPYIFVGVLYLAIASVVRFLIKWKLAGSLMVIVPGVPLLLYFLMILLFVSSGTKWR
jgi:hypothetical protein